MITFSDGTIWTIEGKGSHLLFGVRVPGLVIESAPSIQEARALAAQIVEQADKAETQMLKDGGG